ncbi:hypothetical protein H6F75_17505 [Nodosilinea sp. FACHB-131]|nr:hypothetical protein [Nodosilinea sp. FACHB-131]MBD1875281.1 hypothetical protein [Nodosilinea sp. FACHB-131]
MSTGCAALGAIGTASEPQTRLTSRRFGAKTARSQYSNTVDCVSRQQN